MEIAQRTIEVVYANFKQRYSPRKLIPTEVKTLGDYLLLRRFKANLSQPEVAARTGFTVRKIMAWENVRAIPSANEWEALKPILGLEDSLRPPS